MHQITSSKSLFYKNSRIEPLTKQPELNANNDSSSETEDPLKPQRKPIKPVSKPSIKQTKPRVNSPDPLSNHSSFLRNSGDSVIINYSDYNKQNEDFAILDNESRSGIIEDLFEFDKCFYLNNYSIDIYPDSQSEVNRQARDSEFHRQVENEDETDV